jgi:hypothetical protein
MLPDLLASDDDTRDTVNAIELGLHSELSGSSKR